MLGTLKPRWSVLFPRQLAHFGEAHFERDMDQLVEKFMKGGNCNGNSCALHAPANLWEEEGKWCVELELPGVKQDAVEITLEKNVLKISATRSAPAAERKYWHEERAYGLFERHFKLPETVDAERIEAVLEDGVLRLTLAKKPEAQPKKIEVRQVKPA
jgi:HSP20 family protein